ncbi:polyphosphate--AMP phosphotransferase [Adlercreutzia sp. R21]|uniref:Polyphosphate--AMP phosphotransferase n=1 Tax=Adlercreutzia wanghongyangiae TaxID=3111451 RepID=A0ABU6IG32_9ACTN|nr:polyphosphate--AMP phosphotransferase [Adlercreutzia sp. R21]MEC4175397.1 polyphosphate--AMP phosphotransferase [Adlercreutzia sp. R7]MEC4183533.1 polyphosphate--AMP phosphotransferase [Adlercreutzia sp. R21]
MLEQVDFSQKKMKKAAYKEQWDALLEELVVLQQRAHNEGVGLVVLFEGWNGAGKGSRISDLMYNLDARSTGVYVGLDLDPGTEREFPGREMGVTGYYPIMQDFWKALGERNSITFYDRGWYSAVTQHMLHNAPAKLLLPKDEERHYLDSIHDFERQLVADGYIVVKFFVHMTKEAQVERLRRLHDDPVTRWRVPDKKLHSHHGYEAAYELYDRLLERSNYSFAPWVLLNGEDKRRSNIAIAETLVAALKRGLVQKEANDALRSAFSARLAEFEAAIDEATMAGTPGEAVEVKPGRGMLAGAALVRARAQAEAAHELAPRASRFTIVDDYPRVDAIDHSLALDPVRYKQMLRALQARLFRLENIMYQKRVPLILMYEGWDAAGKGGNIKRVAQALDARAYNIYPSPAPTKPELAHPFLWRYWTRLPKAGHVGMYDRSWYGRVLVERVEGFATPEEWGRAYDEINEFEHDLVDWGAILLKFWVDVSPEEQLRRFQDREIDPAKQWKITEDDWRNREKYPQYKAAIDDMFRLTSTTFAPWIVLESDDKRYARIKALRIIVDALEERLGEERFR